MSTASAKIAQGLGTTFMARQELHLQKQRQKVINSLINHAYNDNH